MLKKIKRKATTDQILKTLNKFIAVTDERFKKQEATSDERFKKQETTNEDILGTINNFATDIQGQLTSIKDEIKIMKTDMVIMKTDMVAMGANMVTKDYLDKKMADLKGELVGTIRKEDTKLTTLVDVLEEENVIKPVDATKILTMEPFARLARQN